MRPTLWLALAALVAAILSGCGDQAPQGEAPRDPAASIPQDVMSKMTPEQKAAIEAGKAKGEQARQQAEAFYEGKAGGQ